jgi:hypothetical protein
MITQKLKACETREFSVLITNQTSKLIDNREFIDSKEIPDNKMEIDAIHKWLNTFNNKTPEMLHQKYSVLRSTFSIHFIFWSKLYSEDFDINLGIAKDSTGLT